MRSLHLVIFHVLCCLIVTSIAQSPTLGDGRLVVDVADAIEGAPIPNAFVFIHGRAGKRDSVLKLKPSGQSEVSLTPGLYDVFVAAGAFAPMCKVVAVAAGQSTHFSAKLKADDEHLEESSHR